MKKGEPIIRPIRPSDNKYLAALIREVLDELEVPKKGTTYADEELDHMYEAFTRPRAAYFVVEEKGRIIGGAGIIQLRNESADICELQKMYLLPVARGRGVGSKLLQKCLRIAGEMNYKRCYLETMSDMETAQQMYIKAGFSFLNERMGDTGHYVCPVWMIITLGNSGDAVTGD